jgi:hypothetical protein
VRRRALGLLRVRVPGDHAALRRPGAGVGRCVRGRVGGRLRGVGAGRRRGGAAGARVRRAGPVRGELDSEHAGGGRARRRGGAEAAGAVQPVGVRAGRGDAAVARAEPRRAHGVPGREPVLRGPPGGAAPGAGGLRRRLHDHRPRVLGPARGGPRRRVPARPEPALLRLPPRHQRPPQPALRRAMGRHPRRRPARVGRPFIFRQEFPPALYCKAAKLQFLGGSNLISRSQCMRLVLQVHGFVAGEDVGDIHGGGAGPDADGGDGRAGARLRARGGAGVLQGVPVRGEPRRRDQHEVARPLRHPPGRLLRRGGGGRPLVLLLYKFNLLPC